MKKFSFARTNSYMVNSFFFSERGMVYCFDPVEQKWYLTSWQNTEIRQEQEFDSLELMYEHLLEKSDARLIKDFEKYFL